VGRLGAADVKIVQALADVATIGLLQERAVRRAELLSEQLQSALNSRVVIEQAKGAIAQFRNVSVDEAFILLRTQARGSGRLLGDLAQGILTDPGTLPELFKAWPTEEGVDPSRAEGKVKHPDQHGEHEDQNS
jgi:hypothetical protein